MTTTNDDDVLHTVIERARALHLSLAVRLLLHRERGTAVSGRRQGRQPTSTALSPDEDANS